MNIRQYREQDRAQVITLWREVFPPTAPHHDPAANIERKTAHGDGLFYVAEEDSLILGTVLVGYDGHRGWIYSLGVAPRARGRGLGSALLAQAENALRDLGCPKVNLQVVASNCSVTKFYEKNGYNIEERISMGKRLQPGLPQEARTVKE